MAKADIARRERLREFLDLVTTGMGRSERREALATYLRGLLLAGEKKNIKAVAHRLAEEPGEVEAYRQRMQQAVVVAKWNEDEVFERICAGSGSLSDHAALGTTLRRSGLSVSSIA